MRKKYILIFIPLLLISGIWFFIKAEPFSVVNNDSIIVTPFSDQGIDGGNSRILEVEEKPDFKAITFELKEGFISPYAGVSFYENSYWDLSVYNFVELEVELENTKNLELAVSTYQNGVTKENRPLTFRHNVVEVPVSDNKTACAIRLDEMHTAQWWLERFKLRSTELGRTNWQKVKSLSLVAKIRLDHNQPQFLKINKITFVKDLSFFYIASLVFAIVWYIGLYIYYKFRLNSRKNTSQIVIRYQKTSEEAKTGDDNSEPLSFITDNYTDPELTLQKLSEIMKKSEKAISIAIKKKYNVMPLS